MNCDFMPAFKTTNTEDLDVKKFEIVKSLLPSHVNTFDLKELERSEPEMMVADSKLKLERLNKFQIGLFEVVSLIMKNEIEKAHAVYKESCNAFFSQTEDYIYNKNKDAFDYVNDHFEEFAKWLLSNWKNSE